MLCIKYNLGKRKGGRLRQSTKEIHVHVLFFLFVFVYFWLCWVFIAALGFSLIAVSGDYSLAVVCGLLTAGASLTEEHRLPVHGPRSCASLAQLPCCCCCCCCVASVVSDSVRPHRRQPARLPHPGILQARTLEWAAISFSNA